MSVPSAYLTVILIWTTTPLAVKWSSEGAGFLFGVTSRMVLGTVLTLAVLALMRVRIPWHREALRVYAASSLGIFGAMFMVYWSAQFIPSGMISVLFATAPVMTSVFAAVLLGERSITALKMLGIVAGLAGLAFVFHSSLALGAGAWRGVVGLLFGVSLFSINGVLVKRYGENIHAMAINGGGLIVGTALYLVTWALLDGTLPAAMPTRALSAIVYLGVVGTVLGFALYMYLLRRIPVATLSLVTLITPVTALYLGHVLNAEPVALSTLIGTALILSGLGFHSWEGMRLHLARQRAR